MKMKMETWGMIRKQYKKLKRPTRRQKNLLEKISDEKKYPSNRISFLRSLPFVYGYMRSNNDEC
jgi:hypothetical protein